MGDLGCVASDARFDATGITFAWPGAALERLYAGAFIAWGDVRDIGPFRGPPEVRLLDGRTLFISATLKDGFVEAAEQAGIQVGAREDVWSYLLDPFLDTDPEVGRERCEAGLKRCGVPPAEVDEIRANCATQMKKLTALTWEWCHYGQADVIDAVAAGLWFPPPMAPGAYVDFRRWTDAVAERGRVSQP